MDYWFNRHGISGVYKPIETIQCLELQQKSVTAVISNGLNIANQFGSSRGSYTSIVDCSLHILIVHYIWFHRFILQMAGTQLASMISLPKTACAKRSGAINSDDALKWAIMSARSRSRHAIDSHCTEYILLSERAE